MAPVRRSCLAAALVAALGGTVGAARAPECLVEWRSGGRPAAPRVVCRDGDACDRDAVADGACTFAVALCRDVADCAATAAQVRVRGRGAAPLAGAVAALGAGGEACVAETAVRLALRGGRRRRTTLVAEARAAGSRRRDRDRLRLICRRAAGGRPARAKAVVVTTDFETGLLATVRVGRGRAVAHLDTPIHADAVVRTAGDRVYVVNRFLGDNVQVLDPGHGFRTLLQCSTGPGSNPHDIAVVGPRKAYVTRFGETRLWIVDPGARSCDAFRTGTIDLAAEADADGVPEMDQMAVVGDRLFVSLERLDRAARFAPTGPSRIAVVDLATDTVIGRVDLKGANAFGDASGLVREPGTGKLVVATVGDFFQTGDGGLERVDPSTLASEGYVITEQTLGGNLTDFVVASPTKGYAVLFVPSNPPRNVLVAFDPSRGTVTGRLMTSRYNLPDIALAPDGTLWVADQGLPAPGIRIFDVSTDRQLTAGPIDVGLPPFSLGFLR